MMSGNLFQFDEYQQPQQQQQQQAIGIDPNAVGGETMFFGFWKDLKVIFRYS